MLGFSLLCSGDTGFLLREVETRRPLRWARSPICLCSRGRWFKQRRPPLSPHPLSYMSVVLWAPFVFGALSCFSCLTWLHVLFLFLNLRANSPTDPMEGKQGCCQGFGLLWGKKGHFGPSHLNTANHASPKNTPLCRRGSIFCSDNGILWFCANLMSYVHMLIILMIIPYIKYW